MKYLDFRRRMAPFAAFSIRDARMLDPAFDRRRLHEWSARGYLRLLTKGHYVFADIDIDDRSLDLIANRLYAPSYVSLETVLSRAGLIPEKVRQVTSVTTRKTRSAPAGLATFSYRTVAPRLFFGYVIEPNGARVAVVEKALLDYLYLHPDLQTREDYESLRMDRRQLADQLDRRRFAGHLARFGSKALSERANRLLEWARYA